MIFQQYFFNLVLFFMVLQLGACRTTGPHKTPEKQSSEDVSTPTLETPQTPARLQKAAVILGPALGRGVGYAGVIKAFQECHAQPAVIYGTDSGAVVAGLWSAHPRLTEWNLFRTKLAGVYDPAISSHERASRFESTVKQIYQEPGGGEKPVWLIAKDAVGKTEMQKVDFSVSRLKGLVNFPGVLGSEDVLIGSAAQVMPFPVRNLKMLGYSPIIVVSLFDSLGHEEKNLARLLATIDRLTESERAEADQKISPNMRGISLFPRPDQHGELVDRVYRATKLVLRDYCSL